ncbi:MAG: MFS transporter [Promethearchaeota archaeon]|nr:MAG: MFS transporter [Candidatus Lokiarchaeota archaeon]
METEENEIIEIETETSKKNVFFYAMYDLANTIYSMIIVSLIINRYVLVIGQLEYGLSYGDTSFIFGVASAIMQIGIAVLIPIIGALSDRAGKRKPFVISLTFIILIFASLIGFYHDLVLVLLFYIIANIAYNFSLIFYDAMLPFIARKEDVGKVSGFTVAWGYLGTIISLLVLFPLIDIYGNVVSDPTAPEGLNYGYTSDAIPFIISMVLFLIFTIPFIFVREKQKKGKLPSMVDLISGAFRQIRGTLKEIRKNRQLFIFILGYFFVSDIASVIILYMTPLVTDGLIIGFTPGLGDDSIAIIFIIISTVSAVLFTYFVGKFGYKYGAKKTFYLVGALWLVSLTLATILTFVTPYILVGLNAPFILSLLVGIIAGPALGGTWVAQRIMVTELAPKEKFGEFMGFSEISNKASSAIGPLVWGAILLTFDLIGKIAYGFALISVGLILVIGIIIISFVKTER